MNPAPQTPHFVSPEKRYCGRLAPTGFDVVLAESLDRFSRDQEDTAGLFKRLTLAGVNIVAIARQSTRSRRDERLAEDVELACLVCVLVRP